MYILRELEVSKQRKPLEHGKPRKTYIPLLVIGYPVYPPFRVYVIEHTKEKRK